MSAQPQNVHAGLLPEELLTMRVRSNSRVAAVLSVALLILFVDACQEALQPRAMVARLEKVSGDSQSRLSSACFVEPLVVRAVAADGHPVAAAAIVFGLKTDLCWAVTSFGLM